MGWGVAQGEWAPSVQEALGLSDPKRSQRRQQTTTRDLLYGGSRGVKITAIQCRVTIFKVYTHTYIYIALCLHMQNYI